MIEVENLTKKYGNHVAVDNLSFRVERGMIYGFLGPNGAGKSTTMNMMTGYIAATSGTVKINGYDMLQEPEKAKKSIGYLPELPPVYQDMTVLEYLKFVAELKKVPKAEQKEQIDNVMNQTKISDVKDRLIKNLSKGYKQRVGLAQAIIGNPEVIILDEPTVGLDPKQIIEIRELIKELSKNHTIILSSHILSEVSAVCDHIMIISKGKLVASDTPQGLMTLMQGSRELKLDVIGKEDSLRAVLEEIEDIIDFETQYDEQQDITHASIHTPTESDIRKELFYALVKSDLPIIELGTSERSLEDVFLELTGEKAAQTQPIIQKEKKKKLLRGHNKEERNEEAGKEDLEDESDI